MILIALGANLPSKIGQPRATLMAAIDMLDGYGIHTVQRSSWYQTSPVPPSGQPDFVNAVAEVETTLPADELLATLHRVEAELGRERRVRWEARKIDLDLLAFHDVIHEGEGIDLPHPRLQERRFVLAPLAEIAPNWSHPVLGRTVVDLLAALESAEICEKMP